MVEMRLALELKDLDQWIELFADLTPTQTYGLVGFLLMNPDTPPSSVPLGEAEKPGNIAAMKRWVQANFRAVLQHYCERRSAFDAAEKALDMTEVAKTITIALFGVLSFKLAILVGAVFLTLKLGGDRWCEKYRVRKFAGEGPYNFTGNSVMAYFEIEYVPAIEEEVQNPAAFPTRVPKIVIEVEKEIKGKAKVPTKKQAEEIFRHISMGGGDHTFSFNDIHSKHDIAGTIHEVILGPEAGLGVVEFTNADISMGVKRL